MPYPKIIDNDRGEITATLAGEEIRGWSYTDDAERRVKMRAAREFVEGWFHAMQRHGRTEEAATGHPGPDERTGRRARRPVEAAVTPEEQVVIEVSGYPFVRCVVMAFDGDGSSEVLSWRPGIDYLFDGSDGFDAVANATGKMRLTIISTHKPGRYPERIFYTREWEAPNGKRFGKPKLHVATRQKFNRLCRGYAVDFDLDPDFEPNDVREFIKRRAAISD